MSRSVLTLTRAQNYSWLPSGSLNHSQPHSKWALSSSTALKNNTRVWLILKPNEMGRHHPITGWYLNGNTRIKPCHGGMFLSSPLETWFVWGRKLRGGWVDSWINMAWRCVTIHARRCSSWTWYTPPFWLPFPEPDREFAHFRLTPRVSFSLHRENEMKHRPGTVAKISFQDDVCLILAAESYTVQPIWTFQEEGGKKTHPCVTFSWCNGPFCCHIGPQLASPSFIP